MVINMATPTEILRKIDKALSEKTLPTALQIVRDNALENKRKQVKDIIDIINIPKYKIVFVGAIGSGKTTAISHLFNLTDFVKTTKIIGKGKKKRKKEVETIKELMTVGSGGTTISEVIIKATDEQHSFFKVDFISKKVLTEITDNFCEQVINSSDNQKSGKLLTTEEERAFRNILDLRPKGNDLKPELQILNSVKNNKEEFKKIIKKRLENVTDKEFQIISFEQNNDLLEDNNNSSEKVWIRKIFEKINVANLDNFSIPKQIELNISNKILGENNPLKDLHSIIDIKGLDAARDKKSIDDYLKKEDTICIFTTRYEVAPDEKITHFIEKHLQDDLKNTHHRFITLMLPRDEEPEKNIGYDGKAIGDWDEGITYKKEVIKNLFKGLGIKFLDENIMHFDAFRYFDNGMPENEYIEDIQDDKDTVIKRVENIIVYRQQMDDLVSKFDKSIDTIINGDYGGDVLNKIKVIIQKIKAYQKLIIDIDFAQEFVDKFDENYWHWATKHAINNRHGVWEWRDIDLKYDSQELIKVIIRKKTIDYKSRINELIISFGENTSNVIYKSISDHLKNEFLSNYNDFIDEVASNLYRRLDQNELKYSGNNLWYKVLDESIKGSGFVYRMLRVYKTELSSIRFFLKKEIEYLWEEKVIGNVLNFLGETELKKKAMNHNIFIPKLKSIRIKNYFSIDKEGIYISNLDDKNEIYFVGENGTGKTILLQAIARALKGEQNIPDINKIISENFRENPLFEGEDSISDNKYSNKNDTQRTYEYLYAYGINRLVLDKNNEVDIETGESYSTLFNNRFSLFDPVDWLRILQLELNENNNFITIETVSNLLSELLEKEVKVYLKGSEVIFEEKGTKLSFKQLSDGYKSSITWISDLLARLSFQQPHVKKLEDYKGIVMVDEIGIYLHPKLKFSLIKKLRSKFKNIQWIFTTHSPITLLGASKNAVVYKIYKIDKEDEKGITQISKPINISGYTANSLITSTIWNIPDFVTAGTEIELVSNVDNIYKNIHKLVSERQKNDPSFDEQDLVSTIKKELSKNE